MPRRLTLVHRASTGRDPFEDVPLLAGRFRLRDDLGTLSSADLDQLWADLYRFRYLANLMVGDNPLARPRFDELRSFGERLETAMGSRPWIDPESDWIAREDPDWGAEKTVETVLDDPDVPEELEIEHVPAYSSGRKFLVVVGAHALLRESFTLLGKLVTVGDWRRAKSERVARQIAFRYYGSGWAARTDVGKFVLPLSLKETIAAYGRANR